MYKNLLVSFYYIKMTSRLSICLSVFIFTCRADNSFVYVSIKTKLAQNDSYVFWHQKVCYLKCPGATIFQHQSIEDTHVEKNCHYQKANGSNPGLGAVICCDCSDFFD